MSRKNIEAGIAVRRILVASMLKEGKVYSEMVVELRAKGHAGSLRTVHKDVKAIIGEWQKRYAGKYDELVFTELLRLLEIDKEASIEWEKSKAGRQWKKIKREPVTIMKDGQKVTTYQRITEEAATLVPDPRWLAIRSGLSAPIQQLLGLRRPFRHWEEEAPPDDGTDGRQERIELANKLKEKLKPKELRDLAEILGDGENGGNSK